MTFEYFFSQILVGEEFVPVPDLVVVGLVVVAHGYCDDVQVLKKKDSLYSHRMQKRISCRMLKSVPGNW